MLVVPAVDIQTNERKISIFYPQFSLHWPSSQILAVKHMVTLCPLLQIEIVPISTQLLKAIKLLISPVLLPYISNPSSFLHFNFKIHLPPLLATRCQICWQQTKGMRKEEGERQRKQEKVLTTNRSNVARPILGTYSG